jgi:hypothetical protein
MASANLVGLVAFDQAAQELDQEFRCRPLVVLPDRSLDVDSEWARC